MAIRKRISGEGATSLGSLRGEPDGLVRNKAGRIQNKRSLRRTIAAVLGKADKPMQVSDLTSAILEAGYRTSSPHLRAIVNQMLIKNPDRYVRTEFGFYKLRK
jgi:hypothetical protein